MKELFYLSTDGKTNIHAVVWECENPKGILQIVHGMAEYALRYAPVAEYYNAQGYIVCAEDHLGHGQSAVDGKFGFFAEGKSNHLVLADIYHLTTQMKQEYPDLPYYILGHSMGSFFTRTLITFHPDSYQKAVIMGTGFQPSMLTTTAKGLCKMLAAMKGWDHPSPFLDHLAFGAYRPKQPAFAWLSTNEENVERYKKDDLCGRLFTVSGFYGLFSIVNTACKKDTIQNTPKDLPIYLVAGSDDPVGNYGKGVQKLYECYQKAGIQHLSMTLYHNNRHEIFNDISREQVLCDILQFLEEKHD